MPGRARNRPGPRGIADMMAAMDRPYRDIPAKSARAYIVMDALEYGKGDWDRGVRFVRLHLRADPENRELRDALAYIEGLGAGR